jgi:hypothetical protein
MSGELFYILVEGEPESPELTFLQRVIHKIFIRNAIDYVPQVWEVGGSSAFNTVAKNVYKLSKAHKKIPILAIADSDYRINEEKLNSANKVLIEEKKVKFLFWQRHEWENYLLDEMQAIAEYINREYKSKKLINKDELDEYLSNYLTDEKTIKQEFWECLKFNLSFKIDKYPSIKKPSDFENQNFDYLENWFLSILEKPAEGVFKPKFKHHNLFQGIMSEYCWQELLGDSKKVTLSFAKQNFRGKEALDNLISHINQNFDTHIDKKTYQKDLLQRLEENSLSTKLEDSAIYTNLENLLLNELKSGVKNE